MSSLGSLWRQLHGPSEGLSRCSTYPRCISAATGFAVSSSGRWRRGRGTRTRCLGRGNVALGSPLLRHFDTGNRSS